MKIYLILLLTTLFIISSTVTNCGSDDELVDPVVTLRTLPTETTISTTTHTTITLKLFPPPENLNYEFVTNPPKLMYAISSQNQATIGCNKQAINNTAVRLTWDKVPGAHEYEIYRSVEFNKTGLIVGISSDNEFIDTPPFSTFYTYYYYRVTAFLEDGYTLPSDYVRVYFKSNKLQGYTVYRSRDGNRFIRISPTNIIDKTYTDYKLPSETVFHYKISGCSISSYSMIDYSTDYRTVKTPEPSHTELNISFVKQKYENNKLYLNVIVYDQVGDVYDDLNETNFSVYEDGTLCQISRIDDTLMQDHSAVATMDYSGSMEDVDTNSMESSLAAGLIFPSKRNDEFEIIKFSSVVEIVCGFTNDKELITEAIFNYPISKHMTSFYDAVCRALDEESLKPAEQRRYVVAFTDGEDNSSSICQSQDDIISKATQYNIPIFCIGYNSVSQDTSTALKNIAEKTGGTYLSGMYYDTGMYDMIFNQLFYTYVLEIDVNGSKETIHTIDISVTSSAELNTQHSKIIKY